MYWPRYRRPTKAQAGQKLTNAVSAIVAAVTNANQVTMPAETPLSASHSITTTAARRKARSQIGRLRFKKNMLNSSFLS